MKSLGWIIAGISAGVLYYLYTNQPATSYAGGPQDDVDDAADRVGNWGSKQRLTGTGSNVVGKVKEGFGRATGNDELAGKGLVDQAVGTVKDAAGQAAKAVEGTIHELNK